MKLLVMYNYILCSHSKDPIKLLQLLLLNGLNANATINKERR